MFVSTNYVFNGNSKLFKAVTELYHAAIKLCACAAFQQPHTVDRDSDTGSDDKCYTVYCFVFYCMNVFGSSNLFSNSFSN